MRILTGVFAAGAFAMIAGAIAIAQRPGQDGEQALSKSADAEVMVAKMMAFDKDKDGKLTRAEITDERLVRLFDRADADKNGSVTKDELTTLSNKEHSDESGFGGGPPGGGPGGPGGPPGGGMMGMLRPGEILSPMLQDRLKLSDEQKTQVEALQKEVDPQLAKVLNDEQEAQLKAMKERGPGGPRGGPGGPGGPGGGRPGGPGGGGPMIMPRPGEVLPVMFQQRLNLTEEQRAQVAGIQKELTPKLEKILTDDQKAQLKAFGERGPRGGGRPPG